MKLNNLKAIRLRKAVTLRELEVQSGVAQSTISRLENGQREPHLSTVRSLADALDVEPGELYGPQ